jgi:hypothetical protein
MRTPFWGGDPRKLPENFLKKCVLSSPSDAISPFYGRIGRLLKKNKHARMTVAIRKKEVKRGA